MQDRHLGQIPLRVAVGLGTLMLITGSAAAWFAWVTPRPPVQPADENPSAVTVPPETTNPTAPPNTLKTDEPTVNQPAVQSPVQAYWLKDTGKGLDLVAVPVPVKGGDRPEAQLTAAIETLLTGTSTPTLTTTIPQGTRLNALKVKADGIHIDLSAPFTTAGGSTGSIGRVAQVLYTATSLNPEARVWLSIAGKPLETIGGEGLMLEQPLTRQMFEADFKSLN
jgi:spore germination protein GerM